MDQKKGRVLCVDDEPNILRSLRWLLQKEFEVDVATSGHEGLEMVKKTDYDVVVSDQRMPGMMGSEFLREVRKVSPRSMRILLTGYSDLQAILRSVNDGEVFRFLTKPWKFQDLQQTVRDAAHIGATNPAPEPVESIITEETAPKGERILVVDDDPSVMDLVTEAVGSGGDVTFADNVAEAVAALDQQDVGIIVSNMKVGEVDATRMLKVLKQRHPEIVTVVYTDATDAVDVIGLINQAQIFRFLPKPVKPTMLKIALSAATAKRMQMRANPNIHRRHAVEALDSSVQDSLMRDIQTVAKARPPKTVDPGNFISRLGGGLMRMFGR